MASAQPNSDDLRAVAPRIPAPTPALQKAEQERKDYVSLRERLEQRSVFRGLIVLAIAALLFSIWHAGLDRVFVGRWWWP